MTVSIAENGVVRLSGVCPIEDAETLFRLLADDPAAAVDWSDGARLHTAVVQVLMAIKPSLVGYPAEVSLIRHIAAAIGTA
jgi:hypothetical protein